MKRTCQQKAIRRFPPEGSAQEGQRLSFAHFAHAFLRLRLDVHVLLGDTENPRELSADLFLPLAELRFFSVNRRIHVHDFPARVADFAHHDLKETAAVRVLPAFV
jgi:hypothetical protein